MNHELVQQLVGQLSLRDTTIAAAPNMVRMWYLKTGLHKRYQNGNFYT